MVKQHEISAPDGARIRKGKRLGRGNGSGSGNYSGRGNGGQHSRAGSGPRPGFEGGQLPLVKSVPKRRGFTNIFSKRFVIVNLERLQNYFEAGDHVDPSKLLNVGLIKNTRIPVKVLAGSSFDMKLVITANSFSAKAKEQILASGGSVNEFAIKPVRNSKHAV
jgi:large subunit ribosomal protein L15